MAKELPYFKFYIGEWLNGDITLEDFECQGLFINICAYYWQKEGDIDMTFLNKRFRGFEAKIHMLIEAKIIKIKANKVVISFLDEQIESKEIQKITNRENGLKGGRPRIEKTEEKPNGLFLETEPITENKAINNPNITNIKERKGDNKDNTQVVPTSAIDPVKFLDYFNKKANRKFKLTQKVKNALKARSKIYSKEEIRIAVDNAHLDPYHIETNFKYLTPEFILREEKIEKFLNQSLPSKQQGIFIQTTN